MGEKIYIKKYNTLVLCGGGSKCIAFCGGLKLLEELKMLKDIKKIIGTSAGALLALLLVLGYNIKEIDEEINKLTNDRIFGTSNNISITSIPNVIYNLWYYNGINDGEEFSNYLKDLFIRKGICFNITFKELYEKYKKNLMMVSTRLDDNSIYAFNYKKTPNIPVIIGLRASTCIPLLFRPIIIKKKYYLDGGLKNNFPINLLSKNDIAIGLKLDVDYNYDLNILNNMNKSNNFIWYMGKILETLFSNSWVDEKYIRKIRDIDIFTIIVPNINFIDFNLDCYMKQLLRNIGYDTLHNNLFEYIIKKCEN
jgi:predicted acylesterase/phospholipase RssA